MEKRNRILVADQIMVAFCPLFPALDAWYLYIHQSQCSACFKSYSNALAENLESFNFLLLLENLDKKNLYYMLKFHIAAAYKSFQLKYNCVVSGAERGAT